MKPECLGSNLGSIYLYALGSFPGPQSSHLCNRTIVHEVIVRCHLQSTPQVSSLSFSHLFVSRIRKEKRSWVETKVNAV